MWNRILVASFLVTATSSASQLYIQGYSQASYSQINVDVVKNQAVAGDKVSDAQSMPFNLLEPYSNFSYAGQASFGHLGLKYQMNTIASLDGFLRVTTYDPLFIAGTQNGILAIDIMLEPRSGSSVFD